MNYHTILPGRELATGPAPGGLEVDDDGVAVVEDLLLELVLVLHRERLPRHAGRGQGPRGGGGGRREEGPEEEGPGLAEGRGQGHDGIGRGLIKLV